MAFHLPPLNSLRAFEAAARHLSFKRAADELNVTPAAISQQIKGLEAALGVVLFHRLPRSIELTEAATAVLPRLRRALGDLLAAVAGICPDGGIRALTLAAPPSFTSHWLLPRLPRFTALHPEIELRISSAMATMDGHRGSGHAADPQELSARVEIRFGTGKYPGYRVHKLFERIDYVAVCSPKLRVGRRRLTRLEDLRRVTLLHDDSAEFESARPGWESWLASAGVAGVGGAEGVDARRGLHFANAALTLDAAADGVGVALVLRPMVEREVAAGRLTIPFAHSIASSYAYYLVCPETVARLPAVAAFGDWLRGEGRLAA